MGVGVSVQRPWSRRGQTLRAQRPTTAAALQQGCLVFFNEFLLKETPVLCVAAAAGQDGAPAWQYIFMITLKGEERVYA